MRAAPDLWARAIAVLIVLLLACLAHALATVVTAEPAGWSSPPASGTSVEQGSSSRLPASGVPIASVTSAQGTRPRQPWASEGELREAIASAYADVKPVAIVLIGVQVVVVLLIGYLALAFRRLRRELQPLTSLW
jgi:hypothetical protein